MTTEKTLIKLESELSKLNEKRFLMTGQLDKDVIEIIEMLKEAIKSNTMESMI